MIVQSRTTTVQSRWTFTAEPPVRPGRPLPPVTVTPLTRLASNSLEATLLPVAGSRPAQRDATDTRIVETITTRSGRIINKVSDVGFPQPAASSTTLDLPADPNGDADGDGYTDLEEWLHARSATVEGR